MSEPLALRVSGLTKSFGASTVLSDIDFEVRSGEVHALLGQNGSGKSTLVKAITGVHSPDSGAIEIFGRRLHTPVNDPTAQGIAVIHQDLGLVDTMTVLENLGVNARYGARLFGRVDELREARIYAALMQRIGVALPLQALVGTLSQAEKAMLAVVRAMRILDLASDETEGHLFILDEPTAPLADADASAVLDVMRRVANLGAGVVFISHRLNEVVASCDRMTVLRAGAVVATAPVGGMDKADIVAAMLGERMEEFFPVPTHDPSREVVLEFDSASGGAVHDVTLAVHEGEVLGVTGLAGMGQDDLLRLAFGATETTSGRVAFQGRDISERTSRELIDEGMAYVPSDRLIAGCWPEGSASENLTLTVMPSLRGVLGQSARKERALSIRLLESAGATPPAPGLPMRAFSGGNQQKIVIEKWRQKSPTVLLLDEPTQGVDPQAAKAILDKVVADAAIGTAVVISSGDYEQLASICHRVVVFRDGRLIAEIEGELLTEPALILACEHETAVTASTAG